MSSGISIIIRFRLDIDKKRATGMNNDLNLHGIKIIAFWGMRPNWCEEMGDGLPTIFSGTAAYGGEWVE